MEERIPHNPVKLSRRSFLALAVGSFILAGCEDPYYFSRPGEWVSKIPFRIRVRENVGDRGAYALSQYDVRSQKEYQKSIYGSIEKGAEVNTLGQIMGRLDTGFYWSKKDLIMYVVAQEELLALQSRFKLREHTAKPFYYVLASDVHQVDPRHVTYSSWD